MLVVLVYGQGEHHYGELAVAYPSFHHQFAAPFAQHVCFAGSEQAAEHKQGGQKCRFHHSKLKEVTQRGQG